jgi:hypothetical protein
LLPSVFRPYLKLKQACHESAYLLQYGGFEQGLVRGTDCLVLQQMLDVPASPDSLTELRLIVDTSSD